MVIDISKLLADPSKLKQRIRAVGIELEGGWTKLRPGVKLTHDGSVRFGGAILESPGGPRHVGELPSPPLEIDQWEAWIRQFYPTHVNESCGMHLHMSFKQSFHYSRLMDNAPNYQDTIVAYVRTWANRIKLASGDPLWARLRGENQYCQLASWPDLQAQATTKGASRSQPGHRYTAVNYPYNHHQTVEIRLLSMMPDAAGAITALQELINITNAYLAHGRREESFKLATIAEDGVREEFRECV